MNTSLQCKWRWELLCLTSDSRLKCEFPVTNSIGPAKSALTSLQYLHTVASLSCTYCSHEKACSYSFWNLYCLPVTESFCFLPTTTSTSCSSSSCSFYCFLKLPSSASFEADLLKWNLMDQIIIIIQADKNATNFWHLSADWKEELRNVTVIVHYATA